MILFTTKTSVLIVVNYLQGLWSRETHPRDFPSSEWLLHFSDLIGASHDVNYRSLQFIKPKYLFALAFKVKCTILALALKTRFEIEKYISECGRREATPARV